MRSDGLRLLLELAHMHVLVAQERATRSRCHGFHTVRGFPRLTPPLPHADPAGFRPKEARPNERPLFSYAKPRSRGRGRRRKRSSEPNARLRALWVPRSVRTAYTEFELPSLSQCRFQYSMNLPLKEISSCMCVCIYIESERERD